MKSIVDFAADIAKKAANSVKLNFPVDSKYDNGVALTPPMGWSSWNTFRNKIDENLILETARAMRDSGLADAGYCYVNLDDCWQSSIRDDNGRLQGDLINFPSGIPALVKAVNDMGLKLGIYTSNGTLTCEDLPSSMGYEAVDAKTFAEWGAEYFKYDFCHNIPLPMRAPYIEYLSIGLEGGKFERTYTAQVAQLYGEAEVLEDERLSTGKFIGGLSANAGYAVFNVEVEEDSEYVITLGIRKKSNSYKYLELLINGDDLYTTKIPPSRGFTADGRHQIKVKLNAGSNTIKLYNPVASRQDSAAIQYTRMGEELKKATREYAEKTGNPERPIVYSICEWGKNLPWKWGRKAGNLWRTTPDIRPNWASVVSIYEVNVKLFKYASVGAWNDPDMLEVGNGELTADENISHFTLWSFMAAPLILGNDIRRFIREDGSVDTDSDVLKILTNKDVIAIDQDPLGQQCRRIKTNIVADTLVKPLANGDVAVCFFNKGNECRLFEHSMNDIVCRSYVTNPVAGRYEAFDLWSKETIEVASTLSAYVPPHGVRAFRIKAITE
ncbi:MAG: alpha-galactosidase [Clostridia bacterium]|nr:alpha-galactosidase [Clostridia bacterium]